jgi:hypothetical protein
MIKLIHLTAWFLLGCITSSFLAWLGVIHPALFRVAVLVYGLITVFLACSIILDDAIRNFFGIESEYYYGVIIAVAVSVLVGAVVTVL